MSYEKALSINSCIGILGGGQLGRMLALAAARLGFRCHVYTPEKDSPAAQVCAHATVADYSDKDALDQFLQQVDVVTFEFENIPVDVLKAVKKTRSVFPSDSALEVTQDRFVEKSFLSDLGIAVAPFHKIDTLDDLNAVLRQKPSGILKTRRFGYDGKGQVRMSAPDQAETAWNALQEKPCILEGIIEFQAEFSVIAVRDAEGKVLCYDPALNVHKNHILHTSTVPANLPQDMLDTALRNTHTILSELDYVGVLGVEFFALADGKCIVNELAPRVHNSGHWTMNACVVDQFENHIRAVAGWPLGDTQRHSNAVMQNLIGSEIDDYWKWANTSNVALHLYGKCETRDGRKMGHIVRLAEKS